LDAIFSSESEDKTGYIDDSDIGITGRIILNPDDTLMRNFFEKNHVKDVQIHGQGYDWMVVTADDGNTSPAKKPFAYVVFNGTVGSNPIYDDSGAIQRVRAFMLKDWVTDLDFKAKKYPDNEFGVYYHEGFLR